MLSHADGYINHVYEEDEDDSNIKENSTVATPMHLCACRECRDDRESGCQDPERCRKKGLKFLLAIKDKWRPKLETIDEDTEDFTYPDDQEEKQTDEREGRLEKRLFRDRIETKTIKDGFRIFADLTDLSSVAPRIHQRSQVVGARPTPSIVVYTDGSCVNNGDLDAKAGAGVWFGRDNPRNLKSRVPEHIPQSNNSGEALAILLAIKNIPEDKDIIIRTDSQLMIDNLTINLRKIEDNGWIDYENETILKAIIGALQGRENKVFLEKVKGHSGNEGNDSADALANLAVEEDKELPTSLYIPRPLRVTGAKLTSMTQSSLYRGILRQMRESKRERRHTEANLEKARESAKMRTGKLPTNERIWESLKSEDIKNKKVRNFLWKCIHDCLPCGHVWEKPKNLEHRARCDGCRTTESIEHILTECEYTGQKLIWNLVSKTLSKKGLDFHHPTLGTILSCGIKRDHKETPSAKEED
jgi:ribonuclease HI